MMNEFSQMLDRKIEAKFKELVASMFGSEGVVQAPVTAKTAAAPKAAPVQAAATTGKKSFKGIRGVAKDPKNDKRFKANRSKAKK